MDDISSTHLMKSDNSAKCGLCFNKFNTGKLMCILKCNHFFCFECIKNKNITHCPFCKKTNMLSDITVTDQNSDQTVNDVSVIGVETENIMHAPKIIKPETIKTVNIVKTTTVTTVNTVTINTVTAKINTDIAKNDSDNNNLTDSTGLTDHTVKHCKCCCCFSI